MNGGSSRRLVALDVAICAVLLGVSVPYTLSAGRVGAGTDLDTVLLPLVVLPILLWRRAPVAAAVALAVGCAVSGFPTFSQFRMLAAIPAGMLISYALATREERLRSLAGLALVLAGMTFVGFTEAALDGDGGGGIAMIALAFPLCIAIWVGGRFVRARALLAAELDERSRRLEERREETARMAVEVERTLLESDIDDAARASVQEMIELAESGERALAADPRRARDAFAEVERRARETLNAMRGLLGVLRSDDRAPEPPSAAPASLEPAPLDTGGDLRESVSGKARRPSGADVALAGALTALLLVDLFARVGASDAVWPALFVVVGGATIVVRRTHPVEAACVQAVLNVVAPSSAIVNAAALAYVITYSCGLYASRRAGLLGLAAIMVGGQIELGFEDPWTVMITLSAVPPWWVGRVLRQRRDLVRALAERNRELEAAEEALTRLSVRRERARVAHELHDVVGHHLAVIAVQARAGQVGDGGVAAEGFAAVRESARQALEELGRLVVILNAEAPTRGLGRLPALLDQARSGGLEVDFVPLPPRVRLPAEVEDTAFRVVQEAVTNTIKHAPGAEVRVRLAVLGDALEIDVCDSGAADASALAASGSGMGLAGISARLERLGGGVEAGSEKDGGWRIRARLPLSHAADRSPRVGSGATRPVSGEFR